MTLTTERLTLRPYKNAGFESYAALMAGNRAVLDQMFKMTDRQSFVSNILPANTASIAVATRLGAQLDPLGKCPDGWDSLVYRHPRHKGRH